MLLDVSFLPEEQLASAERVLSAYHLAGDFRLPSVLADPNGRLTDLNAAVAREFAKRRWVVARCAQARDKILTGYHLDETAPLPEQVMAWLFPAGITTHVLLSAGLRNPTVRRRYVAARDLLADSGLSAEYEPLLELLGCAEMTKARVEEHLGAMTAAFDAAKAVIRTPFPFAADISDIARPIAINGSHELIARGDHREAVFWIAVTYSRCQAVLAHDAPPARRDRFTPGYLRLLVDLGIGSTADLRRRIAQVHAAVPHIWDVAETIMTNNLAIADD